MLSALPLRLPAGRLFRDVVTTYAGFLANAVFGLVTLRLVATHLGPVYFGLANLANIFMAVVAGLGEPGIGTAFVRLAARPGMSGEALDELAVAAIRVKLMVTFGICGLAYGLMPWITAVFMHRPELTAMLRCCLIGAGTLSLASFAGALFQVRGAFRDNAVTIAAAGAVRAVTIVGLYWMGRLNLWTAVEAMILMNVVQFGLCVYALRQMLASLPWRSRCTEPIAELLDYTKYLVVWVVVGTFQPRADVLLLTHYVDDRALGIYAAAGQLCWVVPMLMGSINLVLLPRISALQTQADMNRTLNRCGLGAIALLAVLTPLALWGGSCVALVLDSSYVAAVPIFQLLLLAAATDLALNPFSNFWHALNRPAMLSALNVARLSLLTLIAVIAIPRLGILGAALAVLVSTVIPLTIQGLILWIRINRPSAQETGLADAVLTNS